MARQYTDLDSVENYLLITVADAFTTQITAWIEQVSKRIEKITGRVFIADSADSIRLFEVARKETDSVGRYVENSKDIFIDDAVSITKVVVDGSEISSSVWLAYPANETPKVRVTIKNTSENLLTAYNQNIQVTGKWGYSTEVPYDVKLAATIMVADIIVKSLPHLSRTQSITMGRYSATYLKDKVLTDADSVKELLEDYRRIY